MLIVKATTMMHPNNYQTDDDVDWKHGPCEGVVIVPVGEGEKGLVDGGGIVLEEDGRM
jgi:hypothetical protein